MFSMKKYSMFKPTLTLFFLALAGCQKAPVVVTALPPVPANWVIGSENETEGSDEPTVPSLPVTPALQNGEVIGQEDAATDAEAPVLAETTQALFGTQAASLDALPTPPKTPWRLAAVMTDLSVSASGWLGFLVQKGTPSVTTVWRKQYPAMPAPAQTFSDNESAADLVVNSGTTRAEMERDLEPSIRALLATGTILGEANLRRNLLAAAEDFQNMAALLSGVNPKGQWWISRFRLDFAVDVSGNVTPAVALGAEAKVRFEWHRIKVKSPVPGTLPAPLAEFRGTPGLAENLVAFAENLADDLSEIADGSKADAKGFRAYGYRVGLGISAKGNVGIAKAVTTLTGHLYFSRDVKKPVVHPKPVEGNQTMLLVADGKSGGSVKIDRGAFRKGLRKALRIGRFFSRHAERARGKWKIQELRTGFDLSLGGKTGIVTVGGVAATEISFYNLNF